MNSGTLLINEYLARVLIDKGSTHFFVTPSFVQDFSMAPSRLAYGLSVSTPIGSSAITSKVYRDCIIQVGQHKLPVDLIVLDF